MGVTAGQQLRLFLSYRGYHVGISELETRLRGIFGEDGVSTRLADRQAASRDASGMQPVLPAMVVWPESTEDVIFVVNACREHRVPVTPRGAGSSLMGGSIPIRGGIVLDMRRMNEILEVRAEDMLCRAEAGVLHTELNEHLASLGLTLPISVIGMENVSTLGGMVARNASGIYALKYGGMRRAVIGLTVVTGAGEVIRTGHQCPETSSGYDLSTLMIGSEGTLAVVTEVTLAVVAAPKHVRKLGYLFDDESACTQAITELMHAGVGLAACEYLDAHCIRALNNFKTYGLPEQPALFLEVHAASTAIADASTALVDSITRKYGARDIPLEGDVWALRHWTERAVRSVHPNKTTIRVDIAFPRSLLPDVIKLAHTLSAQESVSLYAFGPAGLGTLEILILESADNFVRWEHANDVRDYLVEFVVDRGGACSGGHGIGLGNKRYMQREHGMAIDVMARVKQAVDPDGLLNPGKICPK